MPFPTTAGRLTREDVVRIVFGQPRNPTLFHVVNERHPTPSPDDLYDHQPLKAWDRVLHGERIWPKASPDRVLERRRPCGWMSVRADAARKP